MGSDRTSRSWVRRGWRFNSRSRVGSDLAEVVETLLAGVSIHAPAWGATRTNLIWRNGSIVSIHAPAWGATCYLYTPLAPLPFQFTLPRGERLSSHSTSSAARWFQFTLPRGERPAVRPRHHPQPAVSIHAPAWGATFSAWSSERLVEVSIHAPAWGATYQEDRARFARAFQFTLPRGERPGCPPPTIRSCCFNSRSRVGSDMGASSGMRHLNVSIHAPAWGATRLLAGPASKTRFQFTLPRGERHVSDLRNTVGLMFQFTLPRGERPAKNALRLRVECFNSRSRVGSDWRSTTASSSSRSFNSRSRVGSDDP